MTNEERAKLALCIHMAEMYLWGEWTLKDLSERLAPFLPWIFSFPDEGAGSLAGYIELGLCMIADGTLTEEEFRDRLKAELPRYGWHPHPPTDPVEALTFEGPTGVSNTRTEVNNETHRTIWPSVDSTIHRASA